MEGFEEIACAAVRELARQLDAAESGTGRAVGFLPAAEAAGQLQVRRWLAEGGMRQADLLSFLRAYGDLAASNHHPGNLAHQIAPPALPAVIADLLQAVTNNITITYELAPPGTVIDREVYRWMTAKAGWAGTGTGTLTSGGSLGNLTALLAARSHANPRSWQAGNPGNLVILAPQASHYSITKAAAVMGIGTANIAQLDVDSLGRTDVTRLPARIAAVRDSGGQPIAVVAPACATATGLHDPIGEIGQICAAHGLWLHVDGAHGASALLSPRLRHRFDGLELADSLVWDAHKMLRTSALCTGVLFREASRFDQLFRQDASYMFHDETATLDIGQRTFETSKAPLGLKLFLNLAWVGEAGLAAYVESQYAKAGTLWQMLRASDGFEVPYQPESNILCFRYAPAPHGQLQIQERLRQQGQFYLSTTQLAGTTYLRASIMSPATSETTMQDLLHAIVKTAHES
jgi:L-2,4-diaminobutyrate decarboxylase